MFGLKYKIFELKNKAQLKRERTENEKKNRKYALEFFKNENPTQREREIINIAKKIYEDAAEFQTVKLLAGGKCVKKVDYYIANPNKLLGSAIHEYNERMFYEDARLELFGLNARYDK